MREKQGLIVGPLPRFLSRPESLFASLFCPSARPSHSTRAHSLSLSHTKTQGPWHRAVTVRENEVAHTRQPNLAEPRRALPCLPLPAHTNQQPNHPPPHTRSVRLPVATRSRKRAAEYRTDMSGLVTRATSRPALFPIVSPMRYSLNYFQFNLGLPKRLARRPFWPALFLTTVAWMRRRFSHSGRREKKRAKKDFDARMGGRGLLRGHQVRTDTFSVPGRVGSEVARVHPSNNATIFRDGAVPLWVISFPPSSPLKKRETACLGRRERHEIRLH